MTEFPVQKIVGALREKFGPEVTHDSDVVGGREMFSFYVVSPAFAGIGHLKRQDAVWAVIDGTLSREEALQVSAVLALAPGELEVLTNH